MTLSTHPTKSRIARSGGFTLVEMLVVIGIIVLLIGILAPALNIAYTHAVRNRMALDIQSIATALEAYKSDMRDYPQLDYTDTASFAGNPQQASTGIMTAAYPASVLLCRALLAPGTAIEDGAGTPDSTGSETNPPEKPGLGFRIIPHGQVYGPYLEASRFKMVQDPVLGASGTNDPNAFFIADRYGHPILYFKAFAAANPRGPGGVFVGTWTGTGQRPMYNLADDSGSATNPALVWATDTSGTANALIRMSLMLGEQQGTGILTGNEQPYTTQAYLLWSAGPDEVFGVNVDGTNNNNIKPTIQTLASQVPNCDDDFNFKP